MTPPGRRYQSLPRASQLILLVSLALCLLFALQIIGQVRDRRQMQAALQEAEQELAQAQEIERRLLEEAQNREIELERAAREEVSGALSDETIIAPQSAPAQRPENAEPPRPQAELTPWQQWWNLFFPAAEGEPLGKPSP
ncbi:MAG: hypothetical protein QHJ81_02655 [Anaerolineae bacterium]|nr:hypothetical protein [Anaerolineae bacterium]